MRRVSIVVVCDVCQDEIDEAEEGSSTVPFTVRGEQREMEICDECIGGSFLQEARPVTNRKKRKPTSGYACDDCGNSFDTPRGLNQHRTKMHGGNE